MKYDLKTSYTRELNYPNSLNVCNVVHLTVYGSVDLKSAGNKYLIEKYISI
jgi:hypothetical protein